MPRLRSLRVFVRRRQSDRRVEAPRLLRQFRALMATRSAEDEAATAGASPATRVAIASFGAGTAHMVVDCLLAHALQLRGAECQLLVCDLPTLTGCDERLFEHEGNERCPGCIASKGPFLDAANLEWVAMTSLLDDPNATVEAVQRAVAECPDADLTKFEYDGWRVGEWLGSSVASFLRSDSHGMRPEVVEARRRYLVAGVVALIAARNWLDRWSPDILVVISGRHVMWRAAREVAEARGIKVVCREMFNEAFDCHIYAVNSSCEDPALPHAWAEARRTPLTDTQAREVDEYLSSLPAFARQIDDDPVLETDASRIRQEIGLDPSRPMFVLFTNVTWDLFVAERDGAFDGQMEWIATTFDFVRDHPEVDLVVRAHPAEIVPKFRTRGRIVTQIAEELAPVPPNVHLVGPESDISSDTLRAMASLNLVYCASVGLEATIAQQPVLICGNPYYAGKGFTADIESVDQYLALLEGHLAGRLPTPSLEDAELARRFLHLMKFRYGMRMGLTTDDVRGTTLTIREFDALNHGYSLALDTACDGILHRDEILLPS